MKITALCVLLAFTTLDAIAQRTDADAVHEGGHQFGISSQTSLDKQVMLKGIFMGVHFQARDSFPDVPFVPNMEGGMYSKSPVTPAADGYFWAARGETSDGQFFFLFDIDDDGQLQDEDAVMVPDGGVAQLSWLIKRLETDAASAKHTRFNIRVQIFENGKAEWQINNLWETKLRGKHEALSVGIMRLMNNQFLAFGDADENGIYETYLDPAAPFGLGGPFWTYTVDFAEQVVVLNPTDKKPVVPGSKAPFLNGVSWPDSSAATLDHSTGKLTLLVFCYEGCQGCRELAPYLREIAATYGDHPEVQFWSVVTSAQEAAGNARLVSPDLLQVISPAAWHDYGVSPTPTVFIVSGNGEILYRSIGTSAKVAQDIHEVLTR